jgi:hypothetical protein
MTTKEYELGKFDGLPEFRVEMDYSRLIPVPVLETRPTRLTAIVTLQQSNTANEDAWKAAGECVLLAGAGVLIAGMMPGTVAIAPTFMRLFGSYATSKGLHLVANQIQFRTETAYGDWTRFATEPWIAQRIDRPSDQSPKPCVASTRMLEMASSVDSNI